MILRKKQLHPPQKSLNIGVDTVFQALVLPTMCFLQLAVWDWFVAVRCLIIFPSTKFFLFSQLQLYMAFIFTVIICTFEFVFISLPCSRLFAAALNFSFASFKVSHCLECIYLKLYDFPFDFWKLDYNMKKF